MATSTETTRILGVANRTASTSLLLDEITRQSRKGAAAPPAGPLG